MHNEVLVVCGLQVVQYYMLLLSKVLVVCGLQVVQYYMLLLSKVAVVCGLQVVQYYRTALSCATLTAGWEKDVAKCVDVIRLAHQLSDGKLAAVLDERIGS